MRHATMAPIIVNTAEEQAALGTEWSEVNSSHYPAWLNHWTKKATIVQDAAADAALGGGWTGSSAAFDPYRGPRPARTDLQGPTKWVDEWSVAELSPKDRSLIKAQLHRADSAYWRSPDAVSADRDAMKLAFDGIAKALFEVGILTEQLLQNEIPTLVWDSAISGGWYRFASDTPERIFPEQLGHYYVWREEAKDWKGIFRSETAHWLAMLIERAAQAPSCRAEVVHPSSPSATVFPITEAESPGAQAAGDRLHETAAESPDRLSKLKSTEAFAGILRDRLSRFTDEHPEEELVSFGYDGKPSSAAELEHAMESGGPAEPQSLREWSTDLGFVKEPASKDPKDVERAKLRSDWLDQQLAQHKTWTSDTDIAENGGPVYNTIRRFRSGALSTRDLYVRRNLSKAFKCNITEVPA
jgi:hypothetical protein